MHLAYEFCGSQVLKLQNIFVRSEYLFFLLHQAMICPVHSSGQEQHREEVHAFFQFLLRLFQLHLWAMCQAQRLHKSCCSRPALLQYRIQVPILQEIKKDFLMPIFVNMRNEVPHMNHLILFRYPNAHEHSSIDREFYCEYREVFVLSYGGDYSRIMISDTVL